MKRRYVLSLGGRSGAESADHSDMTRMQACGRHAREIASFNDGLNPIVSIPAAAPTHLGMPRAGIYLTDDSKTTVHFAPAASLARFAGEN